MSVPAWLPALLVAASAWSFDTLLQQDLEVPLIGTIAATLFATAGQRSRSGNQSTNASESAGQDRREQFSTQREAAQEAKLQIMRNLTNGQSGRIKGDQIADRLNNMIGYAAGRLDYYEDLKHRNLTLGLALFAAALTFGGLLTRAPAFLSPASIVAAALLVLVVLGTGWRMINYYSSTSEPEYSYRMIADIRSWFYRYSLPASSNPLLSEDDEVASAQVNAVRSELEIFVSRWLEYATDTEKLVAEDLEQVFILFTLQRAKAQEVARMTRILRNGLTVTAVLFVLALILALLATVLQEPRRPTNDRGVAQWCQSGVNPESWVHLVFSIL